FIVDDCWAASCTFGIYIVGADANAGRIMGFNGLSNRRWAVYDISFLGNLHMGHHSSDNGIYLPAGEPPTVVSYLGNRYSIIVGQEVWAAANAPSGTTADNTGWIYIGVGGVLAVGGY